MNEFFNRKYMFKILGIFIVLLIIDVVFILNIWESAFGIIGFWLNIVCVVGILYALFLYLKPISQKEDGINIEDLDKREVLNLKEAMSDILTTNDDSNLNKFLLPIKDLSTNWRDKNDEDIIHDLIDKKDKGINITINSFSIYWKVEKVKGQDDKIQDSFNNQNSLRIYELIENFIESRITIDQSIDKNVLQDIENARNFIFYLIQVLDKKGECPSVVDLHHNPNDPDSIRKNVEISSTNLYQMFTQVSLSSHTYKTVEYMIDLLSLNSKIDIITCVGAIIAALGHDIGKIPDYYKNKKTSHPIVSVDMMSNSDFAVSFTDVDIMKTINNAILKHHSASAIDLATKNAKINYDSDDIVLYFLSQSDLSARKYEKEIMLNTTDAMINEFGGKLKGKAEQAESRGQAKNNQEEASSLIDENQNKSKNKKEKTLEKFNTKRGT